MRQQHGLSVTEGQRRHWNTLTAIRDFLHLNGIPAWRIGQRGVRMPDRTAWRVPGNDRGVPDLIGVLPPRGTLLAVDVKTGAGSLSLDQKTVKAAIEQAGGWYVTASSVSDLAEVVEAVEAAAKALKTSSRGNA